MKRLSVLLPLLLLCTAHLSAQYFGRNKPRYQNQNFKVNQTEHFEIYEYLNNPEKLKELAAAAEQWYTMHQAVLQDTFTKLNPILIYNDHAGFQQTNAIQGSISVGTGGVTEGLRNRVVFPIAPTNQQTHHVLGHELVHAFQYNMILNGDSTSMQNLANLPLWMIEGLAEYLSIGHIDPHTALWMRDAVLHEELPKNLRDLDSGRYFPYRWGQSFWAYVTGRYSDVVIRPLFMNTARYGLEAAVGITLKTTTKQLCEDWTTSLKDTYGKWMQGVESHGSAVEKSGKDKRDNPFKLTERAPGKAILTDKNAGGMNICPVVSPNGKYVIFLTEKNLFSVDLYLADAKTGKLIKKVVSTTKDGHIDQMNAIESAGTWSPDSKRFAFDAYQEGKSVLIIKNISKKKTEKRTIPGVPSFSNPTWSPDGRTIVVVGLVNGQTDLFAYDLKTKKVRRLTNDKYAEALPSWNSDGTRLAFSTDQLSMERGRFNGVWNMALAVMDPASGSVDVLDIFSNADNMNPQFDKNGNLIFLSNRDGFRNMYRYDMTSKKVYQMTNLYTGITGITPYSPAISISDDRDRIVYNYYSDGEYLIYQGQADDFLNKEVITNDVNMSAAALPPFIPSQRDIVNTNLRLMDAGVKDKTETLGIERVPYKPKFTLEYLGGGAGAGIMTGNTSFGNNVGVAGGVSMLFGDVLGNNQIFTGLSLNGQIQDIAGQASYINSKNRIGWGFTVSHFPFSSYGGYGLYNTQVNTNTGPEWVLAEELVIDRLFNQRLGGLVFYPFSTTKRIEASAALDFYSQRSTSYITYYDTLFNQIGVVGTDQRRGPRGPRFNIGSVGTAFVGDNAYFGFTSPLQGWRYRVGLERYFGFWDFNTALLDGRYYHRIGKFTFAGRGLTYVRWGGNANNANQVFPFFVAQPWFVRGYGQRLFEQDAELFERIAGSKIAVANAEIRIPFTGPRGIAVLPTNFMLSDLNLFFDAGVAFFRRSDLETQPENSTVPQHKPILSTGVSIRINLFGALIIEPYFAIPLSVEKELRQWGWGFNIQPGW